ncbi:AMIN domain-containing protein [Mesorhizobium australicum]|uniref:AMIN domain-containing protein n=1 Tax=Mesorhizobium australicum TaxID=536018 RepID=A0ACC6T1K9_9HYPH
MPKVKLKQGRQAQEIGASLVGAWLKALPPAFTATISAVVSTSPLRITVDIPNAFTLNDVIALRTEDKTGGIRSVRVGQVTGATGKTIRVVDLGSANIDYKGKPLLNGVVSKVKDLNDTALLNELEIVLEQIVDAKVKLVCDAPTELTVVLPALPEGVVTREDLLDYLGAYHNNAQGRHYHEELASAVLFGCR